MRIPLLFSSLTVAAFVAGCPTSSTCNSNADCAENQYCDFSAETPVCADSEGTADRVAILSFGATPSPILAGESSTLTWETEFASACFLAVGEADEESVDVNGEQSLSPETTTTYSLRCEGEGPEVSDTATIVVSRPVSITSFAIDDDSLDEGDTATLTWASENASGCTLDTAAGADVNSESVDATGSLEVTPLVDTTYTLECAGEGGPVSDSVSATVWSITSFSVDDDNEVIAAPADVTFSFAVVGPSTCAVTGEGLTASGDGTAAATVPAGAHTYTLTCDGQNGDLIRLVTVYGLALTSFDADATDVTSGDDVTFSWEAVEADQCVLTQYGIDTDEALELATVIGNTGSHTAAVDASKDYGLTCSRTRGNASAMVSSELVRVTVN